MKRIVTAIIAIIWVISMYSPVSANAYDSPPVTASEKISSDSERNMGVNDTEAQAIMIIDVETGLPLVDNQITVYVGDIVKLKAVVPENLSESAVTWSSSDEHGQAVNYMTDQQGYITLVFVTPRLQEILLTASCQGETAEITIRIEDRGMLLPSYSESKVLDSTCTKGDIVRFGSYEQDMVEENGKEEIEWLVLDVCDDRAFLISRYALDHKCYHYSSDYVSWEISSLRQWLNSSFLEEAFSEKERDKICLTKNIAEENPMGSRMCPENDTENKIFLLSISEFEKYFSEISSECEPTVYAMLHGAFDENAGFGKCGWWLRSPGIDESVAATVNAFGGLHIMGKLCDTRSGVRPAMIVKMD